MYTRAGVPFPIGKYVDLVDGCGGGGGGVQRSSSDVNYAEVVVHTHDSLNGKTFTAGDID
jgi:hypothetical protein